MLYVLWCPWEDGTASIAALFSNIDCESGVYHLCMEENAELTHELCEKCDSDECLEGFMYKRLVYAELVFMNNCCDDFTCFYFQ